MKIKFTETNVRKIDPEPTKARYIVWDKDLGRFGVRINRESGTRTYVIRYFLGGRDIQKTIGDVSRMTLEGAKKLAKVDGALIAQKKDPVKEQAKELAKSGDNFKARIEPFLAELTKGKPGRPPRSAGYIAATRRSLESYLKGFHGFGLGDITRRMVVDALDEIEEERGFRAAGIAQAHLSSFYGFCMRKGYEGYSPVDGTERRNSEPRARKHSPAELVLIWKATEEPTRYNRIVRLLMLTAMRKTIFGSLRRDEVNRKDRRIEIGIEAGKSKNGEEFLLPLSRQAERIVNAALDEHDRNFVFSEPFADGGFSGWSKAKADLDERITELNDGKPLEPWVLHDFRRTFMSLGQDKCVPKIPRHIADICLYHVGEARKGIGKNYNKADYLDEKLDAMQTWADYIDSLVHPRNLTVVAKT
jgi:integrase